MNRIRLEVVGRALGVDRRCLMVSRICINLFIVILLASVVWQSDLMARPRTVSDVLKKYGSVADKRLAPYFKKAGVKYPPKKIALVGLKAENMLELWARNGTKWKFIRDYWIWAASGIAGPKMKQGDLQVPEGIYQISVLNPNSRFHLSMKVNYPNRFDRAQAHKEKRKRLGGDIFIHGDAVSIGCLAIGDKPIEELFVLVARVKRSNVSVILSPNDLRKLDPPKESRYKPKWLGELYVRIKKELSHFSRPKRR